MTVNLNVAASYVANGRRIVANQKALMSVCGKLAPIPWTRNSHWTSWRPVCAYLKNT